jgi:hypothetical protein
MWLYQSSLAGKWQQPSAIVMLCYAIDPQSLCAEFKTVGNECRETQSKRQLQQVKGETDQDKRGIKYWHIPAQH